MYILAVDLGLRTCGYVVCEVNGINIRLIKEKEIKPNPKQNLPEKLNFIFEHLKEDILSYKPQALVVEKLYSHYRHPTTLGVLAQVKGIIALLAHRCHIDYFEFSSTRARKALLGKGSADSKQVKKISENITGRKLQSVHTADAFSLVFAFAHNQKFAKSLFALKR